MHSQQPPGVVQNLSTLQCSKQNTEQCGYDHAPVTRGRMRAQFPLPHGPTPSKTQLKETERQLRKQKRAAEFEGTFDALRSEGYILVYIDGSSTELDGVGRVVGYGIYAHPDVSSAANVAVSLR